MQSQMKRDQVCVSCHAGSGVPASDGRTWGYYDSRNGRQMLVMSCRVGQRMKINGTIEVVVLEVGKGTVRLGVHGTALGLPVRDLALLPDPFLRLLALHQPAGDEVDEDVGNAELGIQQVRAL
jgi:hypothetical protein